MRGGVAEMRAVSGAPAVMHVAGCRSGHHVLSLAVVPFHDNIIDATAR